MLALPSAAVNTQMQTRNCCSQWELQWLVVSGQKIRSGCLRVDRGLGTAPLLPEGYEGLSPFWDARMQTSEGCVPVLGWEQSGGESVPAVVEIV